MRHGSQSGLSPHCDWEVNYSREASRACQDMPTGHHPIVNQQAATGESRRGFLQWQGPTINQQGPSKPEVGQWPTNFDHKHKAELTARQARVLALI